MATYKVVYVVSCCLCCCKKNDKTRQQKTTDFQLVQRRPVVIASPTTGAETTDVLTIFNLTQKSQKPQIFLFEATIFREFREFCVTFLLSHTHLSSLTTNLHVSSRIFLFLSRPRPFVSIREIRGPLKNL